MNYSLRRVYDKGIEALDELIQEIERLESELSEANKRADDLFFENEYLIDRINTLEKDKESGEWKK